MSGMASLALPACDDEAPKAHSPGGAWGPAQPSSGAVEQPFKPAEVLLLPHHGAAGGPPANGHAAPAASPPDIKVTHRARVDAVYWRLGALQDIGPAGPATAFPGGVVMITKANQVQVARRTSGSKSKTLLPVEGTKQQFARFGRGPAVTRQGAYWTSTRGLLRYRFDVPGNPTEILSLDARGATRVAVVEPTEGEPGLAAYLAWRASDRSMVPMLWVEGAGTYQLAEHGIQSNSVGLVRHGDGWLAVFMDGRMAMTPVHARSFQLKAGKPVFSEDRVIWVGPPGNSLTELTLVKEKKHVWSFLALPRDSRQFGIARIGIDLSARDVPEPSWRLFDNGIDPAPLATAHVCGRATLLFAEPSNAIPRAPQELRWARVDADGIGRSQVIARSRAFSNISLAPVGGGALISYVADRRTWALVATCL